MSKARDIADLNFDSPDIDGADIDGGTINGTIIGSIAPNVGEFTTLTASQINVSSDIRMPWSSGKYIIGPVPRASNLFLTSFDSLEINGADAVAGAQAMAGGSVIIRGGDGVTNSGTNSYAGSVTIAGGQHIGSGLGSGSGSVKIQTSGVDRLTVSGGGNVNVSNRLQVGDSSITQQYPTSGYIADFQASGGTQTYISIAEPNQTSLGDNGVILGEDQGASYLLQRNNKPLHFGTNNVHNRLSISGAGIVSTDVIQARSHEKLWQFLDLTSLNFNTFYPVTLSGGSAQQIATFELHKYYGNHNPVVNGTTMLGSVSMKMDISAYSWGGIPIYNNVAHLGQVYRSMLGAIGMRGYYFPVLWLRGGYGYHYSCNNPNITPQIATSNSTHYTGGYQYTYGPISETSMVSKSEYLGTTNYTVPQNRSALTHWS